MTYLAGTRGLGALGVPDGEPRVVCDCCGTVRYVATQGRPPGWFLDGKPPPGWSGMRSRDGVVRRDWCPECRPGGKPTESEET